MAEAFRRRFGSFEQRFHEELKCSVCLEQYTNPKTLPCLHSFCLECIQRLPVEKKQDRKYYISCPTCRTDHLVPLGGACNFPNAFNINSWLEIKKKLPQNISGSRTSLNQGSSSATCPEHNDPLKVYCETCGKVICCECTMCDEHNGHNYQLIRKCYPKHHRQIRDSLDLVKHKITDIDTAITQLATREKEVLQQGQQLKEQIDTHAQQIIDQVKRSHTHLSQQVDTIVQQKTQTLKAQRQQAQKLHTQLETCQKMIEHSLKEWTKYLILAQKQIMIDEMNSTTQLVNPTVLKPKEKADIRFEKTGLIEKAIGFIISAKQPSTATLTLQSHDPSPLSSSTLSSPGNGHSRSVKSSTGINQAQKGAIRKSNVTPTTRHQVTGPLEGQVHTLPPVLPSPKFTKGKPVKIMPRMNKPCGIAVCGNGDVVVAERDAHCITILNKEGARVKFFGVEGTKEGKFEYPHGVAIDGGNILVTDRHRLQKLTNDGVCVKSVGDGSNSGSGQQQFNYPRGITVHPTTGQIFVADSGNNRIQVLSNNLTFSHTIITVPPLNHPYDVALDNDKYLYVAEFKSHCITKLTTTGQYITRFGSYGFAPGQLSYPSSLTINNNQVYVSEWGNNRVSVFKAKGEFLVCFGEKGSIQEVKGSCGIAIDALVTGNLYVSDRDRLVVFH